jgi:glycosyltransferase involved in cell wall biosynthesis
VVAPFLLDIRIKYIYQPNAERSAARNHGIKLSKGDFITFMDSDEYLLVSHLSKLKEGITKNELKKGVYTFNIGFDYPEDSTHNYTRFSKELQNPINPNDLIGFIIGAPQLCISKVILNKFNFNINIRIGEDTELLFRILSNYPFFLYSR